MTRTRVLPALEPATTFFWTSGADGRLRFLRCRDCGYFTHPPRPRCARCLSTRVEPEPVGGGGTLFSFTVNHQPWNPAEPEPYVIGLVQLDEQADLRLTTNVVDCPVDAVRIGMRVRVVFEQHEDVWLPMFAPEQP